MKERMRAWHDLTDEERAPWIALANDDENGEFSAEELFRFDSIETMRLDSGAHESIEDGMCVMELVSYLAHEPWSDSPQCASPVIAAFLRAWNDALGDEDRQRLRPYAERVIGTRASAAIERQRSLMALDWQIRMYLPAWLRLAGLTVHAERATALAPLTDDSAAGRAAAREVVLAARSAARDAAGAAAWDAARDAAWDAAWDAARDAAWDAAGDAARSAAGAAAWDAARDAAWDAARSAAGSAARSAAWDAAGAAARDAAWDAARSAAGSAARSAAWDAAGSAAWDAAGDALAPTVATLQTSVFELLDAMIALRDYGIQQ